MGFACAVLPYEDVYARRKITLDFCKYREIFEID